MTRKEAAEYLQRERDALIEEMDRDGDKWCTDYIDALTVAVEVLARLASYQPQRDDKYKDLISRQETIDLLKKLRKDGDMVPWEGKDVFKAIRSIPAVDLEPPYMAHYRQGREDEAAEREGGLMQAFSPD